MKSLSILCCVAGMLVLMVGCKRAIDVEKETLMLLQTDVAFSKRSVEAGAAEAFHSYLASDAIQLSAQSDPIEGLESIYAKMKESGDGYTLTWEPKKSEVSRSGDIGYTWGIYTLTGSDKQGEMKHSYGKYLNVWRKQADGSWKVIIDIGNQSPAPAGN